MPSARAVLLLLTLFAAGCCTPVECQPENLPYGGVVVVGDDVEGEKTHQEKLFELLQYSARYGCCSVLYEHLSEATREEYGETTFCLFWESIEVPEPYEYKLVDVVSYGVYADTVPGPKPGQEFAYVNYPPAGQKGKDLLAKILIVTETDEQGREVQKLGLMEQYSAIDAGDPDYWWDASR